MRLQVKDVAKLFGVSEKTIYRWIDQDGLPAFRISKQYRFSRAEVLEWAAARKMNASPQLLRDPSDQEEPIPDLAQALEEGGIFYRVGGTDKAEVLRRVVNLLRVPESMDRDFLFQILLERESLGSTSVGDGIAIPHVRNPIVVNISQPFVTLCFLEEPIEFGALDGKPIHTLFTVISPTIRAHLFLLSSIAFALHDPGFRRAVLEQAMRDTIQNELRRAVATLATPQSASGKGE